MNAPLAVCLSLATFLSGLEADLTAQQQSGQLPAYLQPSVEAPKRAIRRDIPLTNAIQRAYAAGTRDFTGKPGPDYWQLQTDFEINVRLDPDTHTLTGSEKITIHNKSSDELRQIVLRLDHNIFRPRNQRGSSVPAENTDGMVVTRLAIDGSDIPLTAPADQGRRGRGRRPGRGRRGGRAQPPTVNSVRALDQTVARIRLAKPIPAESKAVLEIDWHTKLPGGDTGRGHRMTQRWEDHLFQPTQWFPRLAKYDDLRGWDTNPYLGPAEFYNNFGRFDVRIDVPAGWIVSGTGILQNPEEVLTKAARDRLARVLDSDDTITIVGEEERGPGKATAKGDRLVWHHVADMVNDFAWATSPRYIWQASRATIPEKGPVPIHQVYLPERANRFERAIEISRHALEFYSALWAPYPFPQLTLQDGPSAGMEYPMVINSNQGAADHEVAHQWWPMMLGTNEAWYGWMDEGFNSYMNILSGANSRKQPARLDGRGQSYGRMSGNENEPPMMWNANYGGSMYGYQTYSKAPLMLSMLGGIVGDAEVQRAMSEYTKAWAFKHPSPWDFAFFMSNSLEKDLGWFWYYWLWTTESVDGSIAKMEQSGDMTVVTVRQDGQMPSPIVLKVEFAEGSAKPEAMANAVMQEDGSAVVTWPVEVWFEGDWEIACELDFGGAKVEKVTLDPFGRFPDGDPGDNVWPR
ncbi:MAG: M1 family metallopeptidase [Planctomycetota bacterium]|jgi:hypothetical protein